MKPRTYLLVTLFFPVFSHAVHYRTLVNGNWNNTTNVWSTNGTSPCGCAPSVNLQTDTVTVNHPVNLTAHLSANSSSKLQINQNGALTNALFDVSISNSVLLANGSMNIKKLTVQSGGSFAITNSVLMLNGTSLINGQFNASASFIYLLAGNLDINLTGQLNLLNGTRIQVTNGNIRNYSQLSICSNCCITFDRGGINNESTGQVIGDGAVITYNGNFKNLNSWSTAIDYCSTGNDQGMPMPEDCIATNAICLNAPLSTYIENVVVESTGSYVTLSWESLDNQVDHFLIQRSADALNWTILERVYSPHTENTKSIYSSSDHDPLDGINYYQISVIDINLETIDNFITSCYFESNSAIRLYPNPTDQSIIIDCLYECSIDKIYLYSTIGQLIGSYTWPENEETMIIYLPGISGVYYISLINNEEVRYFKIRKTGD